MSEQNGSKGGTPSPGRLGSTVYSQDEKFTAFMVGVKLPLDSHRQSLLDARRLAAKNGVKVQYKPCGMSHCGVSHEYLGFCPVCLAKSNAGDVARGGGQHSTQSKTLEAGRSTSQRGDSHVATGDLFGGGVRTRVDRPWNEYPVGTKAPAIMGGRWYRTENGWKWNGPDGSGGTFPTPGGDNDGTVILPPNTSREAR